MASQLVHLPEVERLSPAVVRILGGNPGKFTLQGTNTYLVGTGRERLLIDTGEGKASWAAAVQRTLTTTAAAGADATTLAAVLVTHWHPDHVGGIEQVRQLVPGVAVYQSQLAPDAPGPSTRVLDIRDGQTFRVQGATLRAVHTPGHTTDHMAFVFEEENAVFAGDNVLGQGTAVFEDLAVYLKSLARMQTLFRPPPPSAAAGRRIYPGHGPVVEDGPAKIAEYIAHRQQREDQVVQLLRRAGQAGAAPAAAATAPPHTAMDLVQAIYADVPESLHPAAERGLLLILEKLESEGKVVRDGQSWVLRERSPL